MTEEKPSSYIYEVAVSDLVSYDNQPRKHFDDDTIESLKENNVRNGIATPLLVTKSLFLQSKHSRFSFCLNQAEYKHILIKSKKKGLPPLTGGSVPPVRQQPATMPMAKHGGLLLKHSIKTTKRLCKKPKINACRVSKNAAYLAYVKF